MKNVVIRLTKSRAHYWHGAKIGWGRVDGAVRYTEKGARAQAEKIADYYGVSVTLETVTGRGKNPVPPSRFQGKHKPAADAVAAAGDLFRRFTGHEPHKRPRVASDRSRAWLRVGTVDGILYTTNRDNGDGGEVEQYIHRFHPGSRPELLVDQDGKTFRSHGGQFTFTDRGFVDENKQGKAIE